MNKKIKKEIKSCFQVESFEYEKIQDSDLNKKNATFFRIKKNNMELGYFGLCRAKSMYDIFDYAIFFDQNSLIKSIKVLKYNEDYGYEIAAKWFLKQFYNKSNGSNMNYDYDIDGISGATISAKSATKDIQKNSSKLYLWLLQKMIKI